MTEKRKEQAHAEVGPEVFAEVAQKSSRILAAAMKREAGWGHFSMGDEMGVAKAFFDLTAKMMSDPFKLAQVQMNLWKDYMELWQGSMRRLMGQEAAPVAVPDKADRRFKDPEWEEHFIFDYIKQSYLIAAKHMHRAVAQVEGLDDATAKKVDFYTRQYIDAVAPTNFALTNPEVLRETAATGGKNLVDGLKNLLHDLERGKGKQVRVKMTDPKAFKLGENIATTPGKVVFQNDLLQLSQYAPRTRTVYKRPLLIIPPWINKYYILDLRDRNSFVRWAAEQGHTVFVISWVNPDERFAQKSFEDYMFEGPLAAMDAIEQATGEAELDVIGYCLGGTLLACTLAYLTAKKQAKRVASATFFVSLIDFEEPGELGVFTDEQTVASLEQRMNQRGYLEGSEMANTFNMLRANDLIWSFVVNNYLLGKDPMPFDLLHWNSDSTRMPACMHAFYLRNMYIRNALRKPGAINLGGVPIDVTKISTPAYFISTVEDHIAPWKSTFTGAKLMSGPVRFVLGGSGHIAGIINPPAANKYCYWTGAKPSGRAEGWLEAATQHPGSWWTDWAAWIKKHAGARVPARTPGDGKLPVIEDAPGSYASVRLDAH
ncbi:MAG: class I poly(R)-hydroxyalkanoic acid synthase [Betaproteobacteria bacterium]|nr:MAG: class I poly(R)-hydroxyalkanoic acid synthase [Betaproteobacteria bacterium]